MEEEIQKNIEDRTEKNVADILSNCFSHNDTKNTLVVYDTHFGLTEILTDAYRKVLPNAKFLDFDSKNREEIIDTFDSMAAGDMVVLIQSTNFLLNEFRIRLHLFNKNLKVIEHMHLARNDESMWGTYVDALEYDIDWYPTVAPKLKTILDASNSLHVRGLDATLTINGKLESAKLNIGDYTGMINVGGTFPIGEVFTEARNFSDMSGSFYVYAYADSNFNVQMHAPFKLTVKNGLVVECDENTPAEFIKILDLVKSFERPLIREVGFGLNKAISKENPLSDITAFERILGMHFSLGEKHSVYKKEGLTTNKTKFHIDLFPVVDIVQVDDTVIFENGKYLL